MANSFKHDHKGQPISIAKSKLYADKYANLVRKRGYNARVINWAGGSGVYVGRRYNYDSIAKARTAWINEAEEERFESATNQSGFNGGGFQTVPTLSVGGNPKSALGSYQRQGKSRYDMMWTGDSYATDQEKALAEILRNEFAGGEEIASMNSSTENMTEEERNEYIFYKALQNQEELEPVIVNQIKGDNNGAFANQYTTPKRTGRQYSTMGWGVEGKTGPGRFDISTKRARHHVVVSWKLADGGWDEAPLMAFPNRDGAERFLDEISQVASLRGELVLTSDQKGMQTVVPEENIELSIVKEFGEDFATKSLNQENDRDKIISSLNVRRFPDGKLRSSLPGPEEFGSYGENLDQDFFSGWKL